MSQKASQFIKADTAMAMGQSNQDQFAQTLERLAQADRNVLAVCSDSRGSGKLGPFAQRLPDQLVEVGIAEQNLVGVAAGLASCGKRVFAVSPASFLTTRALEQVKNDVCYSDHPVTLVGISAGVSYGALGSTHHSLHDLATLRCIENITIVAPADNHETDEAVRQAADLGRPVYLRLGKAPMHRLHSPTVPVTLGRANIIRDGGDVTFIAMGEAVRQCAFAAEWLDAEGIRARIISMHTIKPLDVAVVIKAAVDTGAIITAEEHSVYGGLGEACASVLMQHGVSCRFKIVGIGDECTIAGSQSEIMSHYGLSGQRLARTARELLGVR